MIKRRFFKQDLADRNDASDSSSSDSDSDSVEAEEEAEEEAITETKEEAEKSKSPSSGSGYESEDSSGNEVDCDSSVLIDEDEESIGNSTRQGLEDGLVTGNVKTAEETPNNPTKASNSKDNTQIDLDDCVLKCKSVFKCRLCPRIVCLSEDTLKAHLNSKRHARSKKLLSEGRLKLMLNSDGEIEEDQETHAERHARIIALAQDSANSKKRNRGRQRQKLRLSKKKLRDGSQGGDVKQSTKTPTKKRRKVED
ncbi:uncharacterized protein LOC131234974 [Magnolia sinica]|uniref:uncharacterized protein LOC131234974 n=1 Tax=Magnolia sinica TaxID=86752 RepID=UPI002659DD64|nr:uncharacterized protein LOC131234974 [Magnolia sinica]